MQVVNKKSRERRIWLGITALLLAIIVILALSPRVLASDQEAETQRLLGLFYEVFRYVQENYVDEELVESQRLMEGALQGLFESLEDPHSTYLTSLEMRELTDTTTGKFGGVGLIISKGERGAEVVSPIEDTPAYQAGIKAGDVIIAIEDESIAEMDLDEVVTILRGSPGTPVNVSILRGKQLQFQVRIVRGIIEVPTVKRDMIPGGIGYLRITQFTPLTPNKVKEALRYFDRNRYRGLIIDLRNNSGGSFSSVIDVADLFLSRGPIVSTRSRVPMENQIYYASSEDTMVDIRMPMVVLINRGSASASEILAGALKDTRRGTLIGENSYGKGSVQKVKRVGEAGFRLTISRYYTPLGKNIDKVGIAPDKEIKEPELSEEEEKALGEIIQDNLIKDFVSAHPSPSEKEVTQFIRDLQDNDLHLRERFIRGMVRDEVDRTKSNRPIYNLDYDIVLQEAVKQVESLNNK